MAVVTFVVVGILFPAIAYMSRPLHPDETVYLVIGQELIDGRTLYSGIADHKPPGIYYVAAALSSIAEQPHTIARVLVDLVHLTTAALIVKFGTQIRNRLVGTSASLLYLVGIYLVWYDGYFFLTEPFCVLLMTAATIAYFNDQFWTDILAGVFLSVAVLFNQTVFLFGLPIILLSTLRLRKREYRSIKYLRETAVKYAVVGAGFVTPLVLVVLFYWWQGVLADFYFYTVDLPLFNYGSRPYFLEGQLISYISYLPVWLLALGTTVTTGLQILDGRQVDDRIIFLGLWLVVLAYTAVTSFQGSHRFQFIFPPAVLLTVIGISDLLKALPGQIWTTAKSQWQSLGTGAIGAILVLAPASFLVYTYADVGVSNRLLLAFPPVVLLAALWLVGRQIFADGLSSSARQRWIVLGMGLVCGLTVIALTVGTNGVVFVITADNTIDQEVGYASEINDHVEGQVYTLAPPITLDFAYFGDNQPAKTWLTAVYADPLAERVIATLERDEVEYVVARQGWLTDDGRIDPDHTYYEATRPVIDYIEATYEITEETEHFVIYRRQ